MNQEVNNPRMDTIEFIDPAAKFEELIVELLAATGYQVLKDVEAPADLGHSFDVDYVIRRQDCTYDILDIKYYRVKSLPRPETLERAFSSVQRFVHNTSATAGVLILSCPNPLIKTELKSRYPKIKVWGLTEIFTHAIPHPELFRKLAVCLELDLAQAKSFVENEHPILLDEIAVTDQGQRIADWLADIVPGRGAAHRFEDVCIDALKYLFESDLAGWHAQSSTIDGLHRRDLVCRILEKSEVWSLLLNDFKSRYVVFEFKNYTEQIGQSEIITTERYLYPTALRNVAIIISQNGHSDSAQKVMDGAMREHGKLIIPITVRELKNLLIAKDNGEDPNSFLFQRVDNFLIGLSR
ncbi:hypothetical protein D3C77_234170 [compost metagenome]